MNAIYNTIYICILYLLRCALLYYYILTYTIQYKYNIIYTYSNMSKPTTTSSTTTTTTTTTTTILLLLTLILLLTLLLLLLLLLLLYRQQQQNKGVRIKKNFLLSLVVDAQNKECSSGIFLKESQKQDNVVPILIIYYPRKKLYVLSGMNLKL